MKYILAEKFFGELFCSRKQSNYIFPKRYPGLYPIAGHSFQVRKLKLGVNDHLMGAGKMGYPDIRISAFEIFGFFPDFRPL